MESDGILPRKQATQAAIKVLAAVADNHIAEKSGNTSGSKDDINISTIQKLFRSATSAAEREILFRVISNNIRPEIRSAANALLHDSGLKTSYGQIITEVQLSDQELLALFNKFERKSEKSEESNLLAKLIKKIIEGRQQNSAGDTGALSALEKLIQNECSDNQTISNSESGLLKAIRAQASIAPEKRGILTEQLASLLADDPILIEQLIKRREELISAKNAVIERLNNLLFSTIPPDQPLELSSSDEKHLIAEYLGVILEKTGNVLQKADKKNNDRDMTLLLYILKTKNQQFADHTSVYSDKSQQSLLSSLTLSTIIEQISEMSDRYKAEPDNRLYAYRQILSALITNENAANRQPKTAAGSPAKTPEPVLLADTPSEKIILKELSEMAGIASAEHQSWPELEKLSEKILIRSKSLPQLLSLLTTKLEQNSDLSFNKAELAELVTIAIKTAIESFSPHMLRASGQFLKLAANGSDMIAALTSLLLPVFSAVKSLSNQDKPEIDSELNPFFDKLDNLKNSPARSQARPRQSMHDIMQELIKFMPEVSESDRELETARFEKNLIATAFRESLHKLNALAAKMELPAINLLNPQLTSCNLQIEVSKETGRRIDADTEDETGHSSSSRKNTSESIKCSVLMPNLGECGISFSYSGSNLQMTITNNHSGFVKTADPLVTQLQTRLTELGFDKADINLRCELPASVRPEWIFELFRGGARNI